MWFPPPFVFFISCLWARVFFFFFASHLRLVLTIKTFSTHSKAKYNKLETQNGGRGCVFLWERLKRLKFVKMSNLHFKFKTPPFAFFISCLRARGVFFFFFASHLRLVLTIKTFSTHSKANYNKLETQNGGGECVFLWERLKRLKFVKMSNLRILWIMVHLFELINLQNETLMKTHFCIF